MPDFLRFREHIRGIYDEVAADCTGAVADYIGPLSVVEPDQWGLAITTVDGQSLAFGDAETDFSIQSVCKPLIYCAALEEHGEDVVHRHAGREPSGQRFNAYTLRETDVEASDGDTAGASPHSVPHNPMINAGAIMCTSLVRSDLPRSKRLSYLRDRWSLLTGGAVPRFNEDMYKAESRTGDRNRALGYMMKNEGAFPGGEDFDLVQLEDALELYFQSCSLELTAREMAIVAATLAGGGICPASGDRVLSSLNVRNCLSLMYSCGMYDFSGEFAFTVGLPAKSGVGGGIILVVS